MALDVFCREELANALRAIYVANEGESGDDQYRRGVHTTLIAVGLAFNVIEIDPAEVDTATVGNLLFGRSAIQPGDGRYNAFT